MTTAQLSINYFNIENIINSSILWFFNNFQKKVQNSGSKKVQDFPKSIKFKVFLTYCYLRILNL